MPGVPPETVDNVKRLLKGIFKRGKSKKQDQPTEQATSTSSQPATSPPVLTPAPNGAAPAVDKPLPPTHPLASGQHEEPQEAVPQNHAAQPGPVSSGQDVKEAESQVATSAPRPTGIEEEEKPPAPPPKNDEAINAPQPIITSGANKENVPATANVALSDSAMATPNTPAKPDIVAEEAKLEPVGTKALAGEESQVEEKVPDHVEPTAPKANPAAHGMMSATSGPLEDFPVGMGSEKE